jgi:hypothetical protein
LSDAGGTGLGEGAGAAVKVVREGDHRDASFWKDARRLFTFLRLAVEVRHRGGVAGGEPAIELSSVSVPLEGSDADGVEPVLGRAALHRDASLDGVHTPIVSRRQRAKFTTSSTGGTASSSPYAVNMRHRRYSRGGNGKNGG